MKKILFIFFLLAPFVLQAQYYLIAGTYTSGKSEGIYVYRFNAETAENSFVSSINTTNPSFVAISPGEKYIYAVNENADSLHNGGTVTSFSFDKTTGTLKKINEQRSGGNHPCYVEIDKTGQWIFTGNYSSGSVGVLHVNNNGVIDSLSQLIKHIGSGPNLQRQQSPHVHATVISADNKYLFVPDLGTDKLVSYKFKNGLLEKKAEGTSLPGSGPRHLSFSADQKFAYLMEEMSGTVVCYKIKNGKLRFIQRSNAQLQYFTGVTGSADIHVSPDGNFLYCSNRGDANNIAIFSVNKRSGKLALVGHQSVLGKKPRNFNFDPSGNFLLVANQDSDEIVIFKIDKASGLLTDTGKRIMIPNPVCIKWMHM
ncbi:MAG: lactonase family protein [Ferruginibacter sp.]